MWPIGGCDGGRDIGGASRTVYGEVTIQGSVYEDAKHSSVLKALHGYLKLASARHRWERQYLYSNL